MCEVSAILLTAQYTTDYDLAWEPTIAVTMLNINKANINHPYQNNLGVKTKDKPDDQRVTFLRNVNN